MSKKITIACESCKSKNYNTSKTIEERLALKKFCPKCKSKTLHKEEK